MLKVTKKSPTRVDVELLGELNADVMREGLDELIRKAGDVRFGRMLYRVENFSFPTVGALAVEIDRLPKLIGLIGNFDRCAVLSDSVMVRTAAEVEGAMLPGIRIRSFTLDEEAAAEAWLATDA